MVMSSILLKNVDYVLTQNSNRDVLRNSSVFIEDGLIIEVGNPRVEAEFTISGKGKVLMPGLINCHTHSSMSLLRGYADDMKLDRWLKEKIWPAESRLTPYHCYVGALLACLEMIKFGVTCFNDMYIFTHEIAKAVEESGLRCFLGEVIFDWNKDEKIPYFKKFIKEWGSHERIYPVVNPHATYTCSPQTLEILRDIADSHKLLIHMHVAETHEEVKEMNKRYGMTPVEYIEQSDLFSSRFIAVHCNWLSENDIRIMSKNMVRVVHCPVSGMKLANSNVPPLESLFRNNVCVALGTDSCASNNNLDMFEEMKACALIHKFVNNNPSIISAQKALDLATINAAKVLGIGEEVGSIEEGKTADVILVDFLKPHLAPVHSKSTVISNLVYSCKGQDVDTTIVNGKILMQERRVLTLDEQDIINRSHSIIRDLFP